MKIVSLQAQNILAIKAFQVTPNGKTVTLKGENGSGKTSVMRCIEMALAGADAIAEKPIHGEEEFGRIILNLGDFKITRMFQKEGSQTTLTVTSPEGAKYPTPQALLNGLCGKLSFDPLEFARMGAREPEKQLKTLKALVGLDFSEMDLKRKTVYEERTMTGRDLKAAETKIAGKMPYPGLPEEPVSVSDLMEELEKANAHNRSIEEAAQSLRNDESSLQGDRNKLTEAKKEIEDLEKKLETLRAALAPMIEAGKKKAAAIEKRKGEVAAMKSIDIAPLQTNIKNADTTNADIRFNQQFKDDSAAATKYKAKYDAQSAEIDAIDAEKQRQLKEAKFPLPGLGFSDTGVTLDGIPFAQCSTGDQIRASAAIGIALNPKLRVLLIRDASLLDKEGLKILAEMAKEKDVQLWLEEVGDSKEVAVTIEGEGQAK